MEIKAFFNPPFSSKKIEFGFLLKGINLKALNQIQSITGGDAISIHIHRHRKIGLTLFFTFWVFIKKGNLEEKKPKENYKGMMKRLQL